MGPPPKGYVFKQRRIYLEYGREYIAKYQPSTQIHSSSQKVNLLM